jgi:hypothetical protein
MAKPLVERRRELRRSCGSREVRYRKVENQDKIPPRSRRVKPVLGDGSTELMMGEAPARWNIRDTTTTRVEARLRLRTRVTGVAFLLCSISRSESTR